ncbi:hypothetical protein [Klebsiella phage vB_KpnM_VAC13]|nr:hypothetical protein [Klebsiella phage vB_KpnM_VAC13]
MTSCKILQFIFYYLLTCFLTVVYGYGVRRIGRKNFKP